jgi:hypothetical protein
MYGYLNNEELVVISTVNGVTSEYWLELPENDEE